jgi:hypothetical protein
MQQCTASTLQACNADNVDIIAAILDFACIPTRWFMI